jgi:hypothetical protein
LRACQTEALPGGLCVNQTAMTVDCEARWRSGKRIDRCHITAELQH